MSKFCTSCGTMLEDEALFCSKCGTKQSVPMVNLEQSVESQAVVEPQIAEMQAINVESVDTDAVCVNNEPNTIQNDIYQYEQAQYQPATYYESANTKNNKGKFKIIIIAIAAILVVLGGTFAALYFTGYLDGIFGYESSVEPAASSEELIDNYTAALFDVNYDAYLSLYPDEYWDEYEKMDKDDFEERYNKAISRTIDDIGEFTYDFTILESNKLKGKEFDKVVESLDDSFDLESDDVTKVLNLKIQIDLDGEDDDKTDVKNIKVYEYKGCWYLVSDFD